MMIKFLVSVAGRVVPAIGLALTFSTAAYAQAEEPFVPQVGQAGKDVVWVPTPPELVERMLDLAKVTPQDFVLKARPGDGVGRPMSASPVG